MRCSKASAEGDRAAALASIPDEMVTTFMIAGTADDARARVAKLAEVADSVTLLPPGTGGTLPAERARAYRQAIEETFHRG